jgi:hypothetical protein
MKTQALMIVMTLMRRWLFCQAIWEIHKEERLSCKKEEELIQEE